MHNVCTSFEELDADFKKLDEIDFRKINLLVNATPIGMYPDIKQSIIRKDKLKNMVVLDTVYNPAITQLLSDAQKNNCKTISGLDFFMEQAIEQFKLFTGLNPDKEEFETILLENRLR